MATTITLLLTEVRAEQDSLIEALNSFVKELQRGNEEQSFSWEHIQDVQGGFRFALLIDGVPKGEGTVRSDFLRPGA